ncbi:dapper homolog 2 [Gastrophryne carolinensis]
MAGWDRMRCAERLRAALAGLQELSLLRATQQWRVTGALTLLSPPFVTDHEFGLESPLNQLDRQICALKLNADKSSCENLSDSRPSSGFYELSDFSSCSLSNSCLSVDSECLSPSHTRTKHHSEKSRNCLKLPEYRPRSADGSTVHVSPVTIGHQVKTFPSHQEIQPQRPASTGDIERFNKLTQEYPNNKVQHMAFFSKDGTHLQNGNPKYQNTLISKNGNERYSYPSPLHAVALQSPLFSLSAAEQKSQSTDSIAPETVTFGLLQASGPFLEQKPNSYENKLAQSSNCDEISQFKSIKPARILSSAVNNTGINRIAEPSRKQTCAAEEEPQYPNRRTEKQLGEFAKQSPAKNKYQKQIPSGLPGRKLSYSGCTGESTSAKATNVKAFSAQILKESIRKERNSSTPKSKNTGQYEFVEAKFIPGESHQARPHFTKNKAITVKRRNSEKYIRPQFAHKEESILNKPLKSKEDIDPSCRPKIGKKLLTKRSTSIVGKGAGGSCLFSDPTFIHRSQTNTSGNALHTSNQKDVQRLLHTKQRKWQSSGDISVKSHVRPAWVQNRKTVESAWVRGSMYAPAHSYDRYVDSSESEYSAECTSLFHSTIIETSDEEASEYTTNRFGDRDSDFTTSSSSLNSHCESLQYNWTRDTSKTLSVPDPSKRHSQPEPEICSVKASKALKKKIRTFHSRPLKVIAMM